MEQTLGSLFTGYTIPTMSVSQAKSYRAEILEKFYQQLEGPYKKFKGESLTYYRLATTLGHIPTSGLEAFYKNCEDAGNFCSYFWWATKEQKRQIRAKKKGV